MLKATIALIVFFAGTGAAYWIKSSVHPAKSPIQQLIMPTVEELNTQARVENLPVREVKEPF